MILALELLEGDPPRLLKLREEDDASIFDVTYRLEADEQGTRFTQISEFEREEAPQVPAQDVRARCTPRRAATAARPQARARGAIEPQSSVLGRGSRASQDRRASERDARRARNGGALRPEVGTAETPQEQHRAAQTAACRSLGDFGRP